MAVNKKTWIDKTILIVSYCAVIALTALVRTSLIKEILLRLCLGIAVILLLPVRYSALSAEPKPCWWQWAAMLLCSASFYFIFRSHWIAFYKLEPIIERLDRWWPVLLGLVAVIGILFSLPLLWKLLHAGRAVMTAIGEALSRQDKSVGRLPLRWIRFGMILLLTLMQFYIMQYSLLSFPSFWFKMKVGYFLLSVITILAVSLILLLFVQRWRYALLGSGILFSAWAIANHYVYKLHGSPLFVAELANAKTAMGVISNYSLSLSEIPWAVITVVFYYFVLLGGFWKLDKAFGALNWKIFAARLGLLALFICPIYKTLLARDAKVINGVMVTYYANRYGFVCVAAADAAKSAHPINVPEGYSADKLPEAVAVKAEASAEYPDIILILNESFCDLEYYTSLKTDRDYMAPFYGIEGAYFGHAAVPSVGGGTNNSEFELLTCFPFYLVGSNAPFNYLDFNKVNSNAVQYMKRLGYYTAGMHFYSRENYHRSTAYPAMGFDESILGPQSEISSEHYGKVGHLDSSYYRLMESYYDAAPADQPRFFYLLTFQNHGGYTANDAVYDTVHAGVNFGVIDDQVDEYLSRIALSAEAFAELTEHFSRSDRDVVICMVGDHAPSFINSIDSDKTWPNRTERIADRTVPYVVWSNYGLDLSSCSSQINLFGLVPQLAEIAGLPMSEYFHSVREMEKEYPILLSDGFYLAKNGKTGTYKEENVRFEAITRCLYIACNSLVHRDDFIEALYLPQ